MIRNNILSVILVLIVFAGGSTAVFGTDSEASQPTTSSQVSSPEAECKISKAAHDAIHDAKEAITDIYVLLDAIATQKRWKETYYTEVVDLIRKAEAVAEPPECDSFKAISLANEAKRLAEEYLVSLRAEQEAREIRKKWASLLFGIFLVLTISYAIYLGYRCVVSEDEKRAAKDSDKLAVVSLILLWACVPVSFFCWYYISSYDSEGTWFLPFIWVFDIAAAVEVGFLFAGIPLVTALVASKKAIIRKDLAASVRRKSYVCFAIGLFIVLFLIGSIWITEITSFSP